MMAEVKNVWQFMHDSPFLTFFIVLCTACGLETVTREFFEFLEVVFQAPCK